MNGYEKELMFSLLRKYKAEGRQERGERFKRKMWFLGSLVVMLVLGLIVLAVSG
jgi:hypothetical protein